MDHSDWISQNPEPGQRLLKFRGDIQTVFLSLAQPQRGDAWLRTNIGHADISRTETIKEVRHNETPMGRDWFDIPMKRVSDRRFQVTLPLCEIGHFEAKCFFLKKGDTQPIWPQGPNITINVEPAETCCANIIYNAFVRQFGPYKGDRAAPVPTEEGWIQTLDKAGYTVIPPSGTFRDLITELDFIINDLGCRIIQLLPVHPTPTTYGRMGRFGSPYASLSFTAVDPALAEFDPRATPLEQFVELVDAVHERNAKITIDVAINHTGWAAMLHDTHPEWLVRDPEGRIEVPGAWGVLWQDLTRLDYNNRAIWKFMADVFLTWCRRGVDGFRCDAGYMIPVAAWKYIIASVREQYPDTIFLLEGLGGKISVTRDLLNKANFNWAYSELFQNYDRSQIETYLPGAIEISQGDGITVHFAETHDNNRLASRSKTFARMRTTLCALCSHQGAFGFANGVEWFATEKINVHGAPSLKWGAETNQVKNIHHLNALLKAHPAFHDRTELKLIQQDGGNHIALSRHHLPSGKRLLVVANLDDENPTNGAWYPNQAGMAGPLFVDLLTAKEVTVNLSNDQHTLLLQPGQVLCLTTDPSDIDLVRQTKGQAFLHPERIKNQCLRAKALDVFRFYNNMRDLGDFDPDQAARHLEEDPLAYCRSLNPFSQESRVTIWKWPQDLNRNIMVPPNHFLLIRTSIPFHARIMEEKRCIAREESLCCADGTFFTLFSPLPPPPVHHRYTLKLSVFTPGDCEHTQSSLLYLSKVSVASVKRSYDRSELRDHHLLFLGTNDRGAMLRTSVWWGNLASRYDALLGANLNPEFPENRWIMFTRCRMWVVYQDYSQEIGLECLNSFCYEYSSRGIWRYQVPTGQGEHVVINVGLNMVKGQNAVRIVFFRPSGGRQEKWLADHKQVRLILRPDIEDRDFHDTTKAYRGPEHLWPQSVTASSDGFTFAPSQNHQLQIQISQGTFIWEPEWQYMVHRPLEAERGLDPNSDLFSPGYFATFLEGHQAVELTAQVLTPNIPKISYLENIPRSVKASSNDNTSWKLDEALKQAIDQYIVKRQTLHTIIAGYPWFLDWGRDALIFIRGLIAAGRTQIARDVLRQFGQFEKQGTIPNMIRGLDVGNRDTSDAPLWFMVACSDLVQAEGNEDFLDEPNGGRTLRQILVSIGSALIEGTPNGIRMDSASCLIFSPSHFSWMDTNHPAGTPRQGYPIEIQALWFAALSFLSRIDPKENGHDWETKAAQVQRSIMDLFMLAEEGYLSDCLHAGYDEPPWQALNDDALRPNQLFAVTFGAVSDISICRQIVTACQELLVPGAIRSLADRPVRHPVEIVHNGIAINDPYHPYQGRYAGDEDTKRKPAYHNGTAWTWLLPTFCEAWVVAYGEESRETAMAWLASSTCLINQGCVGHVPEILDGDFPHAPRGCDAQAWGTSELLRVWMTLDGHIKT
jgi:predicted glycogen debranching enzyme